MRSFVFVLFCSLLFTSCKKEMEGLNRNQKSISPELLAIDASEAGALIPAAIQRIAFYTGRQTQDNLMAQEYAQFLSTPTNFLNNINTTTYVEATWNNTRWNVFTGNLKDRLTMTSQGLDEKYPDVYAIMQIVAVYTGILFTDSFGPNPYIGYGTSNNVPFSSVKDIYLAFFDELDEAIASLQAQLDIDPESGEIRFQRFDPTTNKGNYQKWIKVANTLKLRAAIRLSNVSEIASVAKAKAEEAVDPANGGVLEAEDGAWQYQSTQRAQLWTLVNSWEDTRLSATVQTYFSGFQDPRLQAFALPAEDPQLNGEIVGIRNGVPKTDKDTYLNFSKIDIPEQFPSTLISAGESFFLRAEGALRSWNMGGTAKEFYEEGVKASFNHWGVSGVEDYLEGTTTMTAYVDVKNHNNDSPILTDEVVKWDEGASFDKKLEQIITQKWISFFPEGGEPWAEFRRTGYPKMYPITDSHNPDLPYGTFIRRLKYPAAIYQTDPALIQEAVDKYFDGKDSEAQPLYWDVN